MPYNVTSAIAIDTTQGNVLFSLEKDKIIYPASLTKLMTAYIVFKFIKKGSIGLYDNVRGFSVHSLLRSMIVESDNNSTALLATEIAGSIASFVDIMNEESKIMLLKSTHFTNPTGLFDSNHYSTATDIAKIAAKIFYDFPEYVKFFNIYSYVDQNNLFSEKATIVEKNINGIIGSKTGYISASGFNICMWGIYNKSVIFTVIIGASSAEERDSAASWVLSNSIDNKFNTLYNNEEEYVKLEYFLNLINTDSSVRKAIIDALSPLPQIKPEMQNIERNKYIINETL